MKVSRDRTMAAPAMAFALILFATLSALPVYAAKAFPSVSTSLSATSVTLGGSVYDTANITGAFPGFSGTVSYYYFTNAACLGSGVLVTTVTITNNTVPNSTPQVFPKTGSYGWEAVYSGDSVDNKATSPCEPLTVTGPLASSCSLTTNTCTFTPVNEAYVVSTSPTLNYGADTVLNVQSVTSGNTVSPVDLTYLQFDTSAIPAGMGVRSATLTLTLLSKTSIATGEVGVYLASDVSWSQLTIDWASKPQYSATPIAVNNTIAYTGESYSWSVTPAFSQISSNLTLVLASLVPSGMLSFENLDAPNFPTLNITISSIGNATPPTVGGISLSPPSPSPENLVVVSANVTDNVPVSTVVLSYSVNSLAPVVVQMTRTSNDFYSGTVDRESSNSTVGLTVTATNAVGQTASAYYSYTVSMPAYYTSLQQKYQALFAQLNNLTASLPSQQQWKSFQTSYSNLQVAYTSLRNAYITVEANYNSSQTTLNNLTSTLSSLTGRVSALSTQVTQYSNSLGTWKVLAVVAYAFAALLVGYLLYERVFIPKMKRTRGQA